MEFGGSYHAIVAWNGKLELVIINVSSLTYADVFVHVYVRAKIYGSNYAFQVFWTSYDEMDRESATKRLSPASSSSGIPHVICTRPNPWAMSGAVPRGVKLNSPAAFHAVKLVAELTSMALMSMPEGSNSEHSYRSQL